MLFEITPILLDKSTQSAASARNFANSSVADTTEPGADFASALDDADNTQQTIAAQQEAVQAAAASTKSAARANAGLSNAALSSARVDRSAADMSDSDDNLGFSDVLDILNPLQHIPLVGTIYREATGDTIKPAEQLVGDLIYGGLTGTLLLSGVASVASLAFEQQTGKEPVVMVADAVFGTDDSEGQADAMDASPAAPKKYAAAGSNLLAAQETQTADATNQNFQLAASAQASNAPAESAANAANSSSGLLTIAQAGNKQPFGGAMAPVGAQAVAASATAPSATTSSTTNSSATAVAATRGGPQLSPVTLAMASSQQPLQRIGNNIIAQPPVSRTAHFATAKPAANGANTTNAGTSAAPAATDPANGAASGADLNAALGQASAATGATAAQTSAAQEALMGAMAGSSSAGSTGALAALPQDENTDGKTLGSLMHSSAEARQAGSTLPPDLVHDMMLMALDKYKTAGNYAPSEMTLP
jgi:hypothetical protein